MAALFLVFAAIVTYVASAPAQLQSYATDTCPQTLIAGGFSANFAPFIAHTIHSLTVKELQKFDPIATEKNFIPTVNLDLQSDQQFLSHAPDIKAKDEGMFLTGGMETLDMVLSHMDEKNWGVASGGTLEHIVHDFHMKEEWARTKVQFENIGKTLPTPNQAFCQCALDVENNGIMDALHLVLEILHETQLPYLGTHPLVLKQMYQEKKQGKDAFASEAAQLTFRPLTSSSVWNSWKRTPSAPEVYRDVAFFLYCTIQKAHNPN